MDDALRPHTWERVRRVVPTPLLLLVALITVLGAGTVSASAGHGPETRVRAVPTATADAVGQSSTETAGHVGCLRPSQPGLVSGSCVATNTADDFFQVSGAGANRAGTLVPESFDLSVAGQKFSVHPNATKHMAEYATSTGAGSVPMSSFAGSVETAVARGLNPGRNFVQVGPWELGIDTNGNVIYHAVYRPGAG